LLADLRNANHDSALHKCKSDDMMDLLLRSRANPNAVNIQGETALCTVPAGLVHSLVHCLSVHSHTSNL
jgi:ankyrin repeat protein